MVYEKDFNVKHVGDTYEINEFLRNHPGGVNYIKPYKEKDVTRRMLDTQHSNAAFYLLREYKIGGRNEGKTEFNEDLEVRFLQKQFLSISGLDVQKLILY